MTTNVGKKIKKCGLSFRVAKAKFLCNSLIMSRYKIENKKRVTNWLLLKFPELP